MESVGRTSGLAEGYAAGPDGGGLGEHSAGEGAYQLAQAGSIEILTRCDLPGWRV